MFGLFGGPKIEMTIEVDRTSLSTGMRAIGKVVIKSSAPIKTKSLHILLRASNAKMGEEFDPISIEVSHDKEYAAETTEEFSLPIPSPIIYEQAKVEPNQYEWAVVASLDTGSMGSKEASKPIRLI
ncbi:Uncharacterised protein [uncultured archaeon]|nr:Uncharacterised protein [uncultured archaeon]